MTPDEEPAIGAGIGAIVGLFGTGILAFLLHGPIVLGLAGGVGGSLLGLSVGLYKARQRHRRETRRLERETEAVSFSDD